MSLQGLFFKGKKYTFLLFFLLGAWNVDLIARTGAAILDHILGLKQHIEKQQSQRMLWILDPMELLYQHYLCIEATYLYIVL